MFKERLGANKWRDLAARWASFEVDGEDHSCDMSVCKRCGGEQREEETSQRLLTMIVGS